MVKCQKIRPANKWASLLLLMLVFTGNGAFAQIYDNIYRPTQPEWKQLGTPHFRIIFQQGEEAAAMQTGYLLEDQYPIVQSLVGGSLSSLPVVLNSRNDLSNGYVTTQNFRIEVEIPRIKGKTMNPMDGNWLNTVMPHELVHALHLNVIPALGVSGILRPFSPDMARSLHLAAPLGMIEGIAVFHESHRQYGLSGRGNHPYFTQQHEAVFNSRHRWSLSQMLTDPVRTWPFDRHYIGGHEFINWLQYEYGMEITKKTIRYVSRWPFLGYGSALWYHTGTRPSRLHRQFRQDQKEKEHNRNSGYMRNIHESPGSVTARRVRNPFWISDDVVLYYAMHFNQRPGLYSFDLQSNRASLFLETRSTEDYLFTNHPDGTHLLYARYHRHPYYHNYQRMRLYEVEIRNNGSDGRLPAAGKTETAGKTADKTGGTNNLVDRLHAPVYSPDGSIWALQTHHERNILISAGSTGLDTLLIPENGHLVQLAFHPHQPDSLVLLANRNGLQGLWFLHRNELDEYNHKPADIAFDHASIYDPSWHPSGDYLLFTSDHDGTMNLYEYDRSNALVHRITDHRFGIMEGSYNKDGSRLAAVQISGTRFELVILEKDDLSHESIPPHVWQAPPFAGPSPDPPVPRLPDTDSISPPEKWSLTPYRTGIGWLRPRSFFPTWENEGGFIGHRFGAVLSSGDVLRKHSYFTELSTSNNRFWYDAEYRYSGFFPGFRLNAYRRPIQTTEFLLERQGTGVDFPFRINIDQNTRISGITLIPGLDYLRERIITTGGSPDSDWFKRTRTSLFVSYQHRLQQNIRDVQPNTGWIVFSDFNGDLQTDSDQKLTALRGGIYRYLTFRQRSNRSLRLGIEGVTQNRPFFDISGFYSHGFVDNVLAGVNNSTRLNTRYTIPLWHADRGQVLIPFFLDRFYLVLFSDTVIPVRSRQYEDWLNESRSLFGGGIRIQMRIFNFPVDIGIAAAYEPTRNNTGIIFGPF